MKCNDWWLKPTCLLLGLSLSSVLLGSELSEARKAPSRPNIVIFLADDMGFADAGCYGSEIQTPHLDQLAANGLRFTQFYNTARCWPTRSCLSAVYYAQQIRMDPPSGRLPSWARLLPHYLRPLGLPLAITPASGMCTARPKPVADGGFDRSYWFEDWDRYFSPVKHFEDDVLAPPVKPDSGYYATTAFADQAIRLPAGPCGPIMPRNLSSCIWRSSRRTSRCTRRRRTSPAYRDTYRAGWDVDPPTALSNGCANWASSTAACRRRSPHFTPRYFKPEVLDTLGPGEIQHAVPWNELTDEQQTFQATKMAIHAAMITRMDREIGRVLEQIRAMHAWDDTLIFFLSDNGTDATIMVRGEGHDRGATPGSWQSFLCLGPGWSTVGNTPFRRHKVWVHEGGIATPLIVHWPQGIPARGELRHSPGHVIDFVPTVLDLAGASPAVRQLPPAPPLPGRSLVPLFAKDETLSIASYLFFHHEGNRALRMGNWKAGLGTRGRRRLGIVRLEPGPLRAGQSCRATSRQAPSNGRLLDTA